MAEEMIDIELNLGKELGDKLRGMKKPELLNHLIVNIMRGRVQQETITDLEKQIERSAEKLKKVVDYNEQAQVMIESVMERWNDYSV